MLRSSCLPFPAGLISRRRCCTYIYLADDGQYHYKYFRIHRLKNGISYTWCKTSWSHSSWTDWNIANTRMRRSICFGTLKTFSRLLLNISRLPMLTQAISAASPMSCCRREIRRVCSPLTRDPGSSGPARVWPGQRARSSSLCWPGMIPTAVAGTPRRQCLW